MAKILQSKIIAPKFNRYVIEAPEIARKHKAGQFVMVMMHEKSERIPLTVADSDPVKGTITLVVQEVGKSTIEMASYKSGDEFAHVVGPLGKATHIENLGTCICIGGGAGIAPLYPIAKALKAAGNRVVSILGGRSRDLVILRDEMQSVSDEMICTTDDGSLGGKGFVTTALSQWLSCHDKPEQIVAIGPAIMMKAVAELTRPLQIPTVVSLNSIMVDGTGMCGGCRVEIAGKSQFVCVDGPEFDAHKVNFDIMIQRLRTYERQEKCQNEENL